MFTSASRESLEIHLERVTQANFKIVSAFKSPVVLEQLQSAEPQNLSAEDPAPLLHSGVQCLFKMH